jgi:hypothetical protein
MLRGIALVAKDQRSFAVTLATYAASVAGAIIAFIYR